MRTYVPKNAVATERRAVKVYIWRMVEQTLELMAAMTLVWTSIRSRI